MPTHSMRQTIGASTLGDSTERTNISLTEVIL